MAHVIEEADRKSAEHGWDPSCLSPPTCGCPAWYHITRHTNWPRLFTSLSSEREKKTCPEDSAHTKISRRTHKQSPVIQVMSAVSKSYLQSLIVFAEAHPDGFITAGQCDARWSRRPDANSILRQEASVAPTWAHSSLMRSHHSNIPSA